MGFLDNFKQAMAAAKDAANNNIERQRAEKAAAEAAQKPQVRPRQARPQIDSMGNLKFLMLEANRLNKVVIAELNARGYEAAFTMPLIIRPL